MGYEDVDWVQLDQDKRPMAGYSEQCTIQVGQESETFLFS
jgi:hypothetical protein